MGRRESVEGGEGRRQDLELYRLWKLPPPSLRSTVGEKTESEEQAGPCEVGGGSGEGEGPKSDLRMRHECIREETQRTPGEEVIQ